MYGILPQGREPGGEGFGTPTAEEEGKGEQEALCSTAETGQPLEEDLKEHTQGMGRTKVAAEATAIVVVVVEDAVSHNLIPTSAGEALDRRYRT